MCGKDLGRSCLKYVFLVLRRRRCFELWPPVIPMTLIIRLLLIIFSSLSLVLPFFWLVSLSILILVAFILIVIISTPSKCCKIPALPIQQPTLILNFERSKVYIKFDRLESTKLLSNSIMIGKVSGTNKCRSGLLKCFGSIYRLQFESTSFSKHSSCSVGIYNLL